VPSHISLDCIAYTAGAGELDAACMKVLPLDQHVADLRLQSSAVCTTVRAAIRARASKIHR
jgi:hypothetical protein